MPLLKNLMVQKCSEYRPGGNAFALTKRHHRTFEALTEQQQKKRFLI